PYESGEFAVTGRGGIDMATEWSRNVRSLHGICTRGFPNLFMLGQGRQASLTVNVPHMLGEHASHVATVIKQCVDRGVRIMDVRAEAEQAWADTVAEKAVDRSKFEQECTPGYFNNEGRTDQPSIFSRGFGAGPLEYIQLLEQWRRSGIERDLEFTYV
nr:hypothetical protein [Micromonospora sp. DSM 115978]